MPGSRWCRGGIQTLFLHNGPIRGPGLSLFQRIMFIPLSWLIEYFVRFSVLIVPPIFLWTGVAPLYFTSTLDVVYYQLPVLLAYAWLMRWITPTRYLPLLSTAVGAFSTFRLLPTVFATLIKPFGTPFKVTPKGSGAGQNEFLHRILPDVQNVSDQDCSRRGDGAGCNFFYLLTAARRRSTSI